MLKSLTANYYLLKLKTSFFQINFVKYQMLLILEKVKFCFDILHIATLKILNNCFFMDTVYNKQCIIQQELTYFCYTCFN